MSDSLIDVLQKELTEFTAGATTSQVGVVLAKIQRDHNLMG